ncbi:MAG: MBL fold metallo-hydrolase [candidate division NC10 bacterium]|nr:MBL fold metallo-hydrolase [candidate division NC10 bacterium]
MATTLTVITENTVPAKAGGLYAEHGFALFLDRPEAKILFDPGPAGIATLNNAPRLGIDLRAADGMVLSHGHMDHTGALPGVLRVMAKRVPIYAHPDVFTDRYAKLGERMIYVGLPFKREAWDGRGLRPFDRVPRDRARDISQRRDRPAPTLRNRGCGVVREGERGITPGSPEGRSIPGGGDGGGFGADPRLLPLGPHQYH